jgi:hypothetical protein
MSGLSGEGLAGSFFIGCGVLVGCRYVRAGLGKYRKRNAIVSWLGVHVCRIGK